MRHGTGRLTAVLFSVLAAVPAAAVTLGMTAELTEPTVAAGYPCYIRVTVTNPGGADAHVSNNPMTLSGSLQGDTTGAFNSYNGPGGTIPAGSSVVTIATFVPSGNGSGSVTIGVNTDVGSGSVAIPVTVGGVAGFGAMGKGTMTIRHNILLMNQTVAGGFAFDKPALILLRGEPGGLVNLEVRAASGEDRGGVKPFTPGTLTAQLTPIHLDAGGYGSYMWDGHANTTLDTGVWWIVASGAVNARKPVLIVEHKQP